MKGTKRTRTTEWTTALFAALACSLAATGSAAQTVPAADEAPASPDQLSIGSAGGYFQPGILLQGWWVADILGTSDDEITNTFRIRRAELVVQGEIVPDLVAYRVMFDPAKVLEFGSATLDVENQDPPPTDPDNPEQVTVRQPVSAVSVFQDWYVTFLVPYVDISIGQFKIPVSWEGYNSSSRLHFPERFLASRTWGDRRDLGIRLAKKFDWFGYSLGVFNGAGLNNLDVNNAKDLAARLEAYPVEGLTIAGVVLATAAGWNAPLSRARFEGDVRFERWGFLFQGEYIAARDVDRDGAGTWGQGAYVVLGYTIAEIIQPVARVGYFDPDLDADVDPATDRGQADEFWQFDGGLNWFISKHEAKLQLSYSRFQYDDRTANNQVILAAQVSY